MKYGLWLALGVLAWLWFGHVRRQQLRERGRGAALHRAQPDPGVAAASPAAGAIEAIVACAHCGVHAPLSETVPGAGGARYCCEAHRRLHPGA